MGNELLASKIVVQEEAPRIRNIVGVPTSITGAMGITERGPVGISTEITSEEDFIKIFGRYTANAQDLPLAVSGFFHNGGSKMWITRVVHYTDITNAATKQSADATATLLTAALAASAGYVEATNAPTYNFGEAGGGTLVVAVDGNAPQTATFDAAAAFVTGANTGPYALTNGWTLTFNTQDGARSVVFLTAEFVAIGAATAAEVAAVINAKAAGVQATVVANAVRITTDFLGTGASIGTFGGTANAALGFTGLSDTGAGDVANYRAVTFTEIKTVVEADITAGSGVTVTNVGGFPRITSDTTGGSSSVQVGASSTLDVIIGFDNATHTGGAAGAVNTLRTDAKWDGDYGNDLQIEIAAATSGVTTEFNLRVVEDGNIAEIFPNLTMDDTLPNYVETVINHVSTGSDLITVTDLDAAVAAGDDRPVNGTTALTGGDDGLTGLADTDFTGSTTTGTGLRSFDAINEIRLLIAPGKATSAIHNGMLTYAQVTRSGSMFCVFDPPAANTAAQVRTYVKSTANLKETSEFGAIYWPRIKVSNPNKSVFGNTDQIVAPPSGHICGLMARNDAAQPGNVYEAPAGEGFGDIKGALGVETTEVNDEAKRDLVYPDLINPITSLEGEPVRIDGSRTLCSTQNFPTIGERRGMIFIEQSLKIGLNFSRHRKIKPSLSKAQLRAAKRFMLVQTRNGAFASDDPAKAFFLDFGEGLNTASTAEARSTIGRIGVATAKPNDFVILRFSQDQRALEEEIALAA